MYKMYFKKVLHIILFLFIFSGVLQAQTYDELLANTSLGIDIADRLPPIAELQIEALVNSPLMKLYDAEVEIGKLQITEERREWMRNLGFEGGAKYGRFDNLMLREDYGVYGINTTKTEQTYYHLGAFLKIPLSSIVDRSNVRIAKAEADKLKYQKQASTQELRQLVIIQYNKIIKEHRSLIIKNNAVESYRVQMLRAEKDFSNGKITIADYARLNDMLSKTVLALEDSKLDYVTAFQILEEIVGVKIKLKNE